MNLFDWGKKKGIKVEITASPTLTQAEVSKLTEFCAKLSADHLLDKILSVKSYSDGVELLLSETIDYTQKIAKEYASTFNEPVGTGSEEVDGKQFKTIYEAMKYVADTQNISKKAAIEVVKTEYPYLFKTYDDKLKGDK